MRRLRPSKRTTIMSTTTRPTIMRLMVTKPVIMKLMTMKPMRRSIQALSLHKLVTQANNPL